MSVAHTLQLSPSPHEIMGELIDLPQKAKKESEHIAKYENMVNSFKSFLDLWFDKKIKPDCFSYPPEIILALHNDGSTAAKAIIHANSCTYGASNYQDADGFLIYLCNYPYATGEVESEFISFSLIGRDDDKILYPNKYQSAEQIAKTKEWLDIKLPLSQSLLDDLTDAASNPYLNPQFAISIQKPKVNIVPTEGPLLKNILN